MKHIRLITLIALLLCGGAGKAPGAVPVTCITCSTNVQQLLDSITMIYELTTSVEQFIQLTAQTEQAIYMAKNEANRIRTMPDHTLQRWTEHFERLARLLDETNMYGGDVSALLDIYRAAYPSFNDVYGLAASDQPNPNAIQGEWQKRMERSDAVAMSVFNMSGQQLQRMRRDQDGLREYINHLLTQKNETEIAQASNALTSIMINDLQDIKGMAAMQAQHEADRNLRDLKQEQTDKGLYDKVRIKTNATF